MKNYHAPLVELLLMNTEDILTLSDPHDDDIFNMIEV